MYDFDKLTDRCNTGSLKWDLVPDMLPMWVADMDFECASEIREAIRKRVENPVYGYSITPEGYFESYISWWERRHHVEFQKDWMVFSQGVVPTISSCVRKLTTPAEKVIILSPVYNIFYNSIYNNGRYILSSDLVYENGCYHIDFADLERKMSDPQATLMILCNPHNPIGKIWTREELEKIAELAWLHHVTIISDEIHCDIVTPGLEYVPFMSVSPHAKMNSVTCIAATKCFGIPGLQSSVAVIPEEGLRAKVIRALNTDEVAEGNVFAYSPIISAFNEAEGWVDEMNAYVYENKKAFIESLKDTRLHFVPSDATYLLWVDVSSYTDDSKVLCEFLKEHVHLFITEGAEYGENGKTFVRINLASQWVRILDGAERLKKGLMLFDAKN